MRYKVPRIVFVNKLDHRNKWCKRGNFIEVEFYLSSGPNFPFPFTLLPSLFPKKYVVKTV